jgi:hypothetical protein
MGCVVSSEDSPATQQSVAPDVTRRRAGSELGTVAAAPYAQPRRGRHSTAIQNGLRNVDGAAPPGCHGLSSQLKLSEASHEMPSISHEMPSVSNGRSGSGRSGGGASATPCGSSG